MYVLDANKAIVVTPGTADNEFSNWAMDLRMQVSAATVSSYSWDLTNAPDASSASGTSTYNLTFTWANFTGAAKTDTIIAKETPSGGTQVTQTLTFTVASTSSPAYVSTPPTSYSTWPSVLTPDAVKTQLDTQHLGHDRMAVPSFFQSVTRALRTVTALRGMAPVAQGWA